MTYLVHINAHIWRLQTIIMKQRPITKVLTLDKDEREEEMPNYVEMADKAKYIIFSCLDNLYIHRLRKESTFISIFKQMDHQFWTTSNIGKAVTRDEFWTISFNKNDNMTHLIKLSKYILQCWQNLTPWPIGLKVSP